MRSYLFMYMAATVALAGLGGGCDSAQNLSKSTMSGSIAASFQIQAVEPVSGKPGDRVVVRGSGLAEGLTLLMDGIEITDLTFSDSGGAVEFEVPPGSSGMKKIEIEKNGDRNATAFLVEPDENAEKVPEPTSTDAESEVNPLSPPPAECTKDGQVGCVTTERFRAGDTQAFQAGDLLAGRSVAGVAGQYKPDFPDAGNVLAGDSVDGKPGLLTLPDATNVLASSPVYGNPGAPEVPSMVSADLPEVQNVLSSDTVGGVQGTLTLPAANMVLATAPDYGVGGNGSDPSYTPDFPAAANVLSTDTVDNAAGTLTLPAAGTVLFSAPDYGVGGNGSDPSYTPDFPAAANVRSTDSVNGSPGTLLDCGTDAETGCVANNSFKAADMFSALQNNIAATVTIAGVTGNLVPAGSPAFYVLQPADSDDGVAPGAAFSISFKSFPAAGTVGTVSLYYQVGAIGGCSADPATQGWTLIAGGLNPDFFSYYWTTPLVEGNYFICARFTNSVGTAYQVSSSPLAIGPCRATNGDWSVALGSCFQDSRNLYWSYPSATYMTHASAITYCAGLSQGGEVDWRLPTRPEMLNLIADASSNFPQLSSGYYWTATDYSNPSYAYEYSTSSNSANGYYLKTNSDRAICVRP